MPIVSPSFLSKLPSSMFSYRFDFFDLSSKYSNMCKTDLESVFRVIVNRYEGNIQGFNYLISIFDENNTLCLEKCTIKEFFSYFNLNESDFIEIVYDDNFKHGLENQYISKYEKEIEDLEAQLFRKKELVKKLKEGNGLTSLNPKSYLKHNGQLIHKRHTEYL